MFEFINCERKICDVYALLLRISEKDFNERMNQLPDVFLVLSIIKLVIMFKDWHELKCGLFKYFLRSINHLTRLIKYSHNSQIDSIDCSNIRKNGSELRTEAKQTM